MTNGNTCDPSTPRRPMPVCDHDTCPPSRCKKNTLTVEEVMDVLENMPEENPPFTVIRAALQKRAGEKGK